MSNLDKLTIFWAKNGGNNKTDLYFTKGSAGYFAHENGKPKFLGKTLSAAMELLLKELDK